MAVRQWLILLVLATAVAVWPTNASGQTLVEGLSKRDAWFQSWIAASAVPTPNATVRISGDIASCGDAYVVAISGCSFPDRNEIVVSGSLRGRQATDALMHELGHVFDRLYLSDRYRHRFSQWLRPGGRWWGTNYSTERDWARAGEEQFAEAYRLCSYPRERQRRLTEFRRGGVWITEAHTTWRWKAFRRSCRLMTKIHRTGLNP